MSDLLLPPKPPGSRLGCTVPGVMSPTPGHERQVVPEARLGRVVGHVSAPSRHQRIYHRHMGNRSPEPPFSTKSMDSRPCYLLPRAQASRGRAFRRNNGAGVSGVIPAKPLAPAKAGVSVAERDHVMGDDKRARASSRTRRGSSSSGDQRSPSVWAGVLPSRRWRGRSNQRRTPMSLSSRHVICRDSKPIASARLNAAIAADASLGSSNGLRTDWIWRLVMSKILSGGFSSLNCVPIFFRHAMRRPCRHSRLGWSYPVSVKHRGLSPRARGRCRTSWLAPLRARAVIPGRRIQSACGTLTASEDT